MWLPQLIDICKRQADMIRAQTSVSSRFDAAVCEEILTNKVGKRVLSVLLWVWTGTLYFFIEVIWKTAGGKPESISWTMLLLAIFLAIPLERCGAELPWGMPLIAQATVCTGAITAAEFCAGCVLNLWLGLGVWDYSHMAGNVFGQICPQFMMVWLVLSMFAIVMLDWLRYSVEGGERPHYSILRKKTNF